MKILVLPCDGVGPEIISASMIILDKVSKVFALDLLFEYEEVGFSSLEKYGTTLRDEVLESAKEYDGIILGPQSHASYPAPEKGGRNISASFRVGLDLYANVRPARTRPFLETNMKPGKSMDLVIMREATEGFYPDRNMSRGWGEVMPSPDMALSTRKITRYCSERIAHCAFELAMKRRKKVTAVHKSNSFHMTDGLFLEAFFDIAKKYPEVEINSVLIDAFTAHLVRTPEQFDVVLATNLYGDIISDLASELSGSLGLAGSIMASEAICCAQAQHGSAPDIQGLDKANPTSMILSVAMLLQWLGEKKQADNFIFAAKQISQAIDSTLASSAKRTADLGGLMGCQAFALEVAKRLTPSGKVSI